MIVTLKSNSRNAQDNGDYFIIYDTNPSQEKTILILNCPFCGKKMFFKRDEYITNYSTTYPKFQLQILGTGGNIYIKCCKNYRIIDDEVTEIKK